MTQSAAPRSSGVLASRMFRLGLIALGVFVLVAIGAVVFVSLITSSRNQAPDFVLYPGAQIIDKEEFGKADRQMFTTADTVQDVFNFYKGKLGGNEDDPKCQKIYTTDPQSEDPGKYYARCVVDNSLLTTSQILKITINYQTVKGSNQTVILVERNWGGS